MEPTNKTSGILIHEGKSQFDGAPIFVVVTGLKEASENDKTGDLLQSWILRSDVPPQVAQQTGDDRSVCGDCNQRPGVGGSCYVTTFQAPLSVWGAYHRGNYPEVTDTTAAMIRALKLRIGAYGDPLATPIDAWRAIMPDSPRDRTGYTHAWESVAWAHHWRPYLMASVDSREEKLRAESKGWRCFYASTDGTPDGSIYCPADAPGNVTCADCTLCCGTAFAGNNPGGITIDVHGARASRRTATDLVQLPGLLNQGQ